MLAVLATRPRVTLAHLVFRLVELGVVEAVCVDAKDLSDVNVGARVVNLRVVRPERGVVDTVDFLDPSAGAVY